MSSQRFSVPNEVNELAFTADGRTLAAVGDGPEAPVCLWNLGTGQETVLHGHTGGIHGVAFSPTAPLLATCSEDGTVRLWDLAGGAVRAMAFTPDGRYLATANANGTVYRLRVGPPSP